MSIGEKQIKMLQQNQIDKSKKTQKKKVKGKNKMKKNNFMKPR